MRKRNYALTLENDRGAKGHTDFDNNWESSKAAPSFDASVAGNMLPEFGRWQDVQRLFGIKRGTLYNLITEGKVKSVVCRRKGNVHGCRYFYLPSVSAFLHGLLGQQNEPGDPHKP